MSDKFITISAGPVAEELPGFFGPEQVSPTERIDPEIWKKIHDYLTRNPGGQERLIPLLHMTQDALGYLPFVVQEYIADRLGLSPIQLYGVVSFYHFFKTTPRGRYQLKVCMGTSCFLRHAQRLTEAIQQVLGVEVDGVTNDRLFGLEQGRCLGCCGLAPAMMLNDEVQPNLTPMNVRKLVLGLRSKVRREKALDSPGTSSV
jgi:NADH:ubiquinone oxidoreductase subunit E